MSPKPVSIFPSFSQRTFIISVTNQTLFSSYWTFSSRFNHSFRALKTELFRCDLFSWTSHTVPSAPCSRYNRTRTGTPSIEGLPVAPTPSWYENRLLHISSSQASSTQWLGLTALSSTFSKRKATQHTLPPPREPAPQRVVTFFSYCPKGCPTSHGYYRTAPSLSSSRRRTFSSSRDASACLCVKQKKQ